MAKSYWYDGEVPRNLEITQVYGILTENGDYLCFDIMEKGDENGT